MELRASSVTAQARFEMVVRLFSRRVCGRNVATVPIGQQRIIALGIGPLSTLREGYEAGMTESMLAQVSPDTQIGKEFRDGP